ncbi:hypothetical protein IWQ61_010027 [Dispira simplex]|nr:hypothetical protein IWQ61_010027 [Dispira simplex]
MKILLAYAFLQAVLPSYLATTLAPTDEHGLATLHRRGNAVQAMPGHDGQVTRLRRRSPGISSSLGLNDNSRTDSSSGDDNPPRGEQRTLRRRSNLRRRGDYSMLQRRSPLNSLQRRSPLFSELFNGDDNSNTATDSSSGDENSPGSRANRGPYGGVSSANQGPYDGVSSANQGPYGGVSRVVY